jgi:hypothetical protein
MTGQFRDWDIALLILVLMILSFLPEWRQSVRKFREGRALARQSTAEHAARESLERGWKESHS